VRGAASGDLMLPREYTVGGGMMYAHWVSKQCLGFRRAFMWRRGPFGSEPAGWYGAEPGAWGRAGRLRLACWVVVCWVVAV